jgi:ferrochelatase
LLTACRKLAKIRDKKKIGYKMVLPKDHPHVKPRKTGVLLLNLGTPDGTDYWSVRRYLSEFLSDKRIIDYPSIFWQPLLQGIILTSRPFKSGHAYSLVWDKERDASPIRVYTESQHEKLIAYFKKHHPEESENLIFEWGMRYGNPSTKLGIEKLFDQGCDRIILFALYPQYSACTTGTAYDKAFETLEKMPRQPAIRTAEQWHDDPAYIDVLAQSVKDHIKLSGPNKPEHIIASFHGLPKRYLMNGDPYHCFCSKTARLLREKLKWKEEDWTTTFQSRFGPEEWLQPYTDKTIEALAEKGVKHLAIISPAFVSDCIETLEEINIGLREAFLEKGGETFTYIPCLNDRDDHIAFLAGRIKQELAGWVF